LIDFQIDNQKNLSRELRDRKIFLEEIYKGMYATTRQSFNIVGSLSTSSSNSSTMVVQTASGCPTSTASIQNSFEKSW